jgi:hypothetical protein
VSFLDVTVREYGYELGDHPLARGGLPLGLGWDPIGEATWSVDDFERRRRAPYGFSGILLSAHQRRDILVRAGYSHAELARAEADMDWCRLEREVERQQELKEQMLLRNRRRFLFLSDLASLRAKVGGRAGSSRRPPPCA